MNGLRSTDSAHRDNEFMDLTSLTQDEFAELLPSFEEAFQKRMKEYRSDGHRREGRGYVTYTNCPLSTPADRLLFILVYLKTNALQMVHGRMFGLPQNKANQWIHTLWPVVQSTLQQTGDAPAQTIEELKNHLDERVQPEELPLLFVTMAPNDGFLAHKMLMNRKAIIVARKNVTR